ncbi:7-cyano-7-deazaguanine/7-aminomethyl-7-deazaguanine transporter [Legionella spiritensis]|uniref:7-cyano-7-deazaguanine/7-aminomethyl-7- deazaguanine transporter n=1 Tax=Legionella spiritensis TaxID=452 RepID=UPI000F6C3CC2|nr:7-cyano-7-deazaguanine/7-aminomethyl-7-deazaguanine transporter [Legionella spiritensis]VEG91648.1 membrane protein [Legionella spiritensis]
MGRFVNIALLASHIFIICLSNILVQFPLTLFGYHTTWGAFSYPLIFILTDLTTRLHGPETARKIVFMAMIPGLTGSFLIANWFTCGMIMTNNPLALRIALASFLAYILGQLGDIALFQKLRRKKQWWIAPSAANVFGNILDTYFFFFVAFFHGSNAFLSRHWLEIASVDLIFKLLISQISFIPLYGLILGWILRRQQGACTATTT